jgi:hypothetical protein
MTEPTLEEQAFAALQEQHADVVGSLARILGALDIDGDEDGWEDDAVELIERLHSMLDAAHGLICNAHQKRVDDVTTEDGASEGWAGAARRWIDAYPPALVAESTPKA